MKVLEGLLLGKKHSHAANIKVKKIYGVLKTQVFWDVTLLLCVPEVSKAL
jgi:hypothetical protein